MICNINAYFCIKMVLVRHENKVVRHENTLAKHYM